MLAYFLHKYSPQVLILTPLDAVACESLLLQTANPCTWVNLLLVPVSEKRNGEPLKRLVQIHLLLLGIGAAVILAVELTKFVLFIIEH